MARRSKFSDEALAAALASGATQTEAAKAGGVSKSTVQRRLLDSGFLALIRKTRARLLDRALGKISHAAAEAVSKLRELLDAESPAIQLGAARAILEHVVRLREHAELADRMAEIETEHGELGERFERFKADQRNTV